MGFRRGNVRVPWRGRRDGEGLQQFLFPLVLMGQLNVRVFRHENARRQRDRHGRQRFVRNDRLTEDARPHGNGQQSGVSQQAEHQRQLQAAAHGPGRHVSQNPNPHASRQGNRKQPRGSGSIPGTPVKRQVGQDASHQKRGKRKDGQHHRPELLLQRSDSGPFGLAKKTTTWRHWLTVVSGLAIGFRAAIQSSRSGPFQSIRSFGPHKSTGADNPRASAARMCRVSPLPC